MLRKKPVKQENAWLEELKKVNSNVSRLDSKLKEVTSKLDKLVNEPNYTYLGITLTLWSLGIALISYYSTIGEISIRSLISFLVPMFGGMFFIYVFIFSLWSKLLKRTK